MQIITHGHSLRDAVRQILQLFFDINSEFCAESELTCENNKYIAAARVNFSGKTALGKAEAVIENPSKREISDLVKKSVLFACKKLSDMPAPWGISTGIRPAKTARIMLECGASDEEILSYMEEEFLVTGEKSRLCLEVAKKERQILSKKEPEGISIYVGIPFCPTRCAYCSFISQAVEHNRKFLEPFCIALEKEITATGRIAEKMGFKVETIYFGGGTPTTLPPKSLDGVIKSVKKNFDISLLKEFTVEAGRPDTFSEEMIDVLSENGVNRISINPQTMNQKTLDSIGRFHSVEQTQKAFEMTKKYGSFSINADIIAALPGEEPEDFKRTVRAVSELEPNAVTVHTMYLKRAARLIDDFEKLRFVSNAGEMVGFAYDYLTGKNYLPYYLYKQKNTLGNLENVGFCMEGHESLYNIYIMEEIQTVLALGGGASTKLVKENSIERIYNPKDAADYIARIDEVIEKKRQAAEILKQVTL